MATAIVLKREIIKSRLINNILGVSIFVVLTSLGAFVRIPLGFTPVPLTLQTFFVLLSGAILGSNLGLFSQAGYLLLGAAGLPIFSGAGSGLLYLFGPTAGYLWGFIIASFVVGRLINSHLLKAKLTPSASLTSVPSTLLAGTSVRPRPEEPFREGLGPEGGRVNPEFIEGLNFWSIFLYMSIANIILLLCGTLWLYLGLRFTIKQAILLGFLPFVAGDIIKIIVAAHLYKNIQTRTKEIFS